MNEPQKEILLFTFDYMNEVYGRTFIQKLFYVFQRQLKLELFDYFEYKFGPFSKELNQAVSELVDSGYVEEKRIGDYYLYLITEKGKQEAKKGTSLSDKEKKDITGICSYAKNRGWKSGDLLRYVYKKYPEATVNSVLKRRKSF